MIERQEPKKKEIYFTTANQTITIQCIATDTITVIASNGVDTQLMTLVNFKITFINF